MHGWPIIDIKRLFFMKFITDLSKGTGNHYHGSMRTFFAGHEIKQSHTILVIIILLYPVRIPGMAFLLKW